MFDPPPDHAHSPNSTPPYHPRPGPHSNTCRCRAARRPLAAPAATRCSSPSCTPSSLPPLRLVASVATDLQLVEVKQLIIIA